MKCLKHSRETFGACTWCGKTLCERCELERQGNKVYCEKCTQVLVKIPKPNLPRQILQKTIKPIEAKHEAFDRKFALDRDGYFDFSRVQDEV